MQSTCKWTHAHSLLISFELWLDSERTTWHKLTMTDFLIYKDWNLCGTFSPYSLEMKQKDSRMQTSSINEGDK